MQKRILVAVVFCISLALLLVIEGPARAETGAPQAQGGGVNVAVYLGCLIDSQRHLNLRNTTSTRLRIGTSVYWSIGQERFPHKTLLYLDVLPSQRYPIDSINTYGSSALCRVWVFRPSAAAAQ